MIRYMNRRHSLRLGGLFLLTLAGCEQDGKYPKAQVTSPLNRPGTCHHCGKAIATVSENNLVTLKAAQYVVCDEKCGTALKKWHESQFGK